MTTTPHERWVCFLCTKKNDESEKDVCVCCKRPRSYAPKSRIDAAKAQPLALHGLAASNHPFRVEQIEALVAGGLELGAQDTLGWMALHCAARVGQDRVVAAILDKAASPNELLEATTSGGWRALHHAAACGHLPVVEELLAADAKVDVRTDGEGLTPLHLAAMHGRTRIMALLLECSANPNLTTDDGLERTALHLAVGSGHADCVKLLLAKTDLIRVSDAEGITPLQQAHLLQSEPGAQVKEQLIKLLETHQHPLERAPLLSSFLKSAVA